MGGQERKGMTNRIRSCSPRHSSQIRKAHSAATGTDFRFAHIPRYPLLLALGDVSRTRQTQLAVVLRFEEVVPAHPSPLSTRQGSHAAAPGYQEGWPKKRSFQK